MFHTVNQWLCWIPLFSGKNEFKFFWMNYWSYFWSLVSIVHWSRYEQIIIYKNHFTNQKQVWRSAHGMFICYHYHHHFLEHRRRWNQQKWWNSRTWKRPCANGCFWLSSDCWGKYIFFFSHQLSYVKLQSIQSYS